ncbi:Protein FANTASTIC FOUR 3 [Linum grandiflorum]
MGTVVCQGLQSCLESQIAESRTLRLRLSAPKSDSSGWGCLTDPTHFIKPDSFFPQPSSKRSVSSSLSEKSLELCTENLGSETGADQQLSDYLFSSAAPSSEGIIGKANSDEKATVAVIKSKTAARRRGCGSGSGNGFPPPLTTMRGPELIQVRPHREGGRLVMKAVKSQSPPSCFQAERIDSRLLLHVVVDHSVDPAFDSAPIMTEDNDIININNNSDYAEENEIREEEGVERRNTSWKEEEEEEGSHHQHQHQHQQHNKGGLVGLNWEPFRVATALQV